MLTVSVMKDRKKSVYILVGISGSGKTSVGKQLAGLLSKNFIDTDELIENSLGKNIESYLEANNIKTYRELEGVIISKLLDEVREGKLRNAVISLSPGYLDQESFREKLRDKNVIALQIKPEDAFERVRNDRALLKYIGKEKWLELQSIRARYVNEICLNKINVTNINPKEIAEEILRKSNKQ